MLSISGSAGVPGEPGAAGGFAMSEPVLASGEPGAPGRGIRVAVAVLVAALAGLGGCLLLADGDEPPAAAGGADTPSEALAGIVEAILAGDPEAASALLEPAESAWITGAGLDPIAELAPLTVLEGGSSIADLAGRSVEAIGLQIDSEPLRPGLQSLSLSVGGSLQGTVDIARLRPAAVLSSWLPVARLDDAAVQADQAVQAGPVPIVAVRRDGRWYVSVWYTFAEHVRTISGSELPDRSERPPAIGAATVGEAAEAVMEEMLALDARRLVGMLDPTEASAVYDYAPLLLGAADAAANRVLAEREADEWAWEAAALQSAVSIDGDEALVTPTRLAVRGAGSTSHVEIDFGPDGLRAARSGLDFWGEPVAVELSAGRDGACEVVFGDGTQPAQPGAPAAGHPLCSAGLALPGTMVFRQVDDRWYLAPTRSALRKSLGLLDLLGLTGMNEVISAALADAGLPAAPAILDLDAAPGGAVAGQRLPAGDSGGLLAPGLGEPDWAYAMNSAGEVEYEMSQWFPGGLGIDADSGIYAYFEASETGSGGAAVVVLETGGEAAATAVVADLAAREGSEPVEGLGGRATRVVDTLGPPVLVAVDGPLFVLAGSLGADESTVRALFEAQLRSSGAAATQP